MKNSILKSYIHLYEKNKLALVKYWISNKKILKLLKKYDIEIELFIKKYAVGIIDYYIDVVNDKKEIGDCPTIEELVIFLKDKNITASELFLLCTGFKNSLIEYSYDLKITNLQIEKEINYIFELNFEGVLSKYFSNVGEVKQKLTETTDIVDKYIIMSKTDPKGKILSVSTAFCEISGYSKDELIGESHNIVRHPDMPSELFSELWETISDGKQWHGEIKNLTKNGDDYWVDVRITPIFDNSGKIIYYDAIRQDITSKKDLEDHQSILIEQSKSAAMGEMISMIAHQWRQPLQAVSILIQKLPLTKMVEGTIPDELLNQVVEDISTQLEYMSKTIDDFRDFFLPDKPKEEVLISEVINKSLEFVSFMIKGDGIEVNITNEKDSLTLVHVNELIQVFINLFKNAKDAMVEKKIENRKINIQISRHNNFAIVEIEDNAGGIPEDIIEKVFEPYFSTKSDKNGTGLGLYMCKTIIEKYSSGLMSVSNTENGAKFTIKIPLSL